jgi:hypothetical protein
MQNIMSHFGERFYPKNHITNIRADLTLVDDRGLQFGHIANSDILVFSDNFTNWFTTNQSQAYYPRYLFEILANPETRVYNIVDQRPYFLSCLNRVPRDYRCRLLLEILSCPWVHQVQYSLACLAEKDQFLAVDQFDELAKKLTVDEFQRIQSLLGTCIHGEYHTDGWGYTTNASVAHKNCYVDLVTESNLMYHQITEKTWKPMLSGQLFLILGATGIIKHLRETGVDVFDDFIDHSYDNEPDVIKRIKMIVGSLHDLEKNVEKIWAETYQRRIKNFNLVRSKEYQDLLLKDLIDKCT